MKDNQTLPAHIAVIMDGNGRWAGKRLLPRTAGHAAGLKRFAEIAEICSDIGVKYLTVYAFSTENINRSAEEVSGLFSLAYKAIDTYIEKLLKKNIRAKVIGDVSMIGDSLLQKIRAAEQKLKDCTGMTLCIAFCYGGRHELAQAANAALAA
ncbi:MAG: di-trans,poly-cis-decaprenylcistransferase, partial [Clostridia bacterium]|nr:di-trans,poly-cis-decaprenylcistransferase [Clostridia bacterium]